MLSIIRKFSLLAASASCVAVSALFSGPAAAADLNLVRLLPDPGRPRIYAVNTNGLEQGSLLVIDSINRSTLKTIPLGKKPTDCDISQDGKTLFAINSVDQTLALVDLETLTVTQTISLPGYSNWGAADTHAHVRAGKGNIVYFVDGQWGPRLRVFDRATGTVLQTFGAKTTGTSNDDGIGGLVLAPDGSAIYTWKQYGWTAGVLGTYISKFSVNANGTLTYVSSTASARSTNFDRDPLDTPAMISPDGSRLFVKDRVFLTSNLSEAGVIYPDEIYSMSNNAEVVAGAASIYAGNGGEILYNLPKSASVQAITPDFSSLVYFNTTTKALGWVDLITTIGATKLGLVLEPADGSIVAQPSRLSWYPVTGIQRYQLYLGTDRNTVQSATTVSSTYLGESMTTSLNLNSTLTPGQTYFWKVVPINSNGSTAGAGVTRSFTVSNVTLSRSSIEAETVAGVRKHEETIDLAASSPQAWSATSNASWLTLEHQSGSTPSKLVARFNASSLAAGYHQATITVTSGGSSFQIPANLRVHAANYMISEADLDLPWVYAISQESNTSSLPSFLVRINTETDTIESAVPCGRSVTDLAIHYQENRIYLTNWQTGVLRAFDRSTFQQVQTYQFSPAGPVGYGEGDIWRVAAGKKGRVIVEESDQWIQIRLIDTANGAVLASSSSEYSGDGEADPTGRYYYHNEGLLSSDSMIRFDLNADSFAAMTPTVMGQGSSVVMIADGSKVTAGSRVYNAPLEFQFALPSIVTAGSLHGDLLFTSNKAYNGNNGIELATLPVNTSVMSVTGDQEKLYLFPANSKTFTTVKLSTIATLPPRGVIPEITDGSTVIGTQQTLAWSLEPFATSYRVYFGTSKDAVANATEASPEYLGSTLTNSWSGTLPTLALDGNYFWRVDVAGFSDSRKGSVWSFDVAPIGIDPAKLDITLPVSSPIESRTLTISGPVGLGWTASTSTPWLSLNSASGDSPGTLQVNINVTGLAAGTHQGSVRFTSGADIWNFPVSLELLALNYTLAEADLEAPYIYAISQAASGTDDRAHLLAIDTRTAKIARVVPVGRSVTDLAIHYLENRIYVSNWNSGKLIALDRDTLTEVRTYAYGPSGGYGTSSGDVYQVAAGSSGRIVIEQEDQWINFFLIDTASGNKIATGSAREGGGVFDPTGRYYFHGENNSSGAELIKYDTGSNTFTKLASKRVSAFSYYGARRVLTSGDGSSVFWNGGVFDPDLNVRMLLTDEVVSSTYRGEVLFTDDSAFNGINGEKLSTLPVTTTIQGVSFDQSKLYLFKSGTFSVVNIGSIAQVSPRGLIPGIADGSTVIGTNQSLSWSQEAAAISYDVYFGNSKAEIAAATPSSPEFLGNATGTVWNGNLPTLTLGSTYWWRVDIRGFNSTVKGYPWSFKIAPINVTPRSLDLAFPGSSPIPRQRLDLTGTPNIAWSASSTTPWITLISPSGITPDTLEFDISSSGLAAGAHQGTITLKSGSDEYTVPVNLRILALNVTKLVAHPTRPVVYGINTAAAGEGFSHLLEIDAATANILRSLPIGFSPTDADIDPAADRLYVSNWGYSQTRVVDLTTWTELPSLALGDDVYRLNVAPGGRLLTEKEDQWISLDMWDAANASKLATAPSSVHEGDGETDQAGGFYYHCDNNISNAHITKYSVSSNSFVKVAESAQIGYGSRNLILSRNGERLFWISKVFDSGLSLIGQTPAEIYATNHNGILAIGSDKIWWSDSATQVAALPFASTVAVVSSNDSHLLRFNGTTRTLHSTALNLITDLPGPEPRPGQVLAKSPDRISWSPVPGATSYRVFIAPNASALAAMTFPTAIVTPNWYDIPSPLAFGNFYTWRADAVTATGTVAGKAQSFGIHYPKGPAIAAPETNKSGSTVAMSNSHLLVGNEEAARLYQFDPETGGTSLTQSISIQSPSWDPEFRTSVAMDSNKATVGDASFANPLTDGGAVFLYRKGELGYWQHSGPLVPPTPVEAEGFGAGLAASGNLMLAGVSGGFNSAGRVAAYLTEPSAIRTQILNASDGVSNDGFGRVIAMEGNQAIISAPGGGTSYTRVPSIYAFTRSTSTGSWTQTQKINISGSKYHGGSATALALSGNTMATNNGTTGEVLIYTKNASNQWSQSASIRQADVPGSSFSSFGDALAVAGDQLFIGDENATYGGYAGGAIFTFRRSGTTWTAGPVIGPSKAGYGGFGKSLAIRDGWLLAAGGETHPAWLFRVENPANQTPVFSNHIPTQVVAGRSFSTEIRGSDDGVPSGLVFDKLQGPTWLTVTSGADGTAILSGTPVGSSGSVHTVQLRLRDALGAQSLYAYQLTLLSPTDLPALTMEPVGGSFGEGQEVILRAAASGIGPFTWQWYRNGEEIPGANKPTLLFREISAENAGSYVVRVSNVVGHVDSTPSDVAVTSADRFAGDWPTFGGSARHTGYHPAHLGDHTFVSAWSKVVTPSRALNRAAVAEGKVFVTPQVYFGGSFNASALDLKTGATVWNHPFAEAHSLNPPSYHNGRVYIQRGNHGSDTQLWALRSDTGASLWNSPHGAQWENYEAPAVTDEGIWINGGSYGGMYGFDLTGKERFFKSSAQYDEWTPTVSEGRLFSWIAGDFREHNPADGNILWSVSTVWDWRGWSMGTVSAVSGDSALLISTTELICVDLPSRSIRWRKAGSFTGSPAIAGDHVYAIKGKTVESYSLADGSTGSVITVPETILSGQPLLLMDHLLVAGSTNTYVVRRSDSAVIQTLSGGGLLSYSEGMLIVAGIDGTLRAWHANVAPEFARDFPTTIQAADTGEDSILDAAQLVTDGDPDDVMSWEFAPAPMPLMLRSLAINPATGRMSVVYNPHAHGTTPVTLVVTDSAGNTSQATIELNLPKHAPPKTTIDSTIRFNRSNGLYEQKVTVKNVAAREIAGFELNVSGLRSGVKLYNATTQKSGGGCIAYNKPIAAGKSVTLLLKYYAARRGTIPQPSLSSKIVAPVASSIKSPAATIVQKTKVQASSAAVTPASATTPTQPFAISRFIRDAGGSVMVEFPTESGRNYRIQYSADCKEWNTCPETIAGDGHPAFWVDRGPPSTASPPALETRRFYRVARIDP